MNYAEIREALTKDHSSKFKFERWIIEEEANIICNEIKDYPTLYESGTANGFSSYYFSRVISGLVHTFDPVNRPKIWDFLELDRSRIKYYDTPFGASANGVMTVLKKNDLKAFFIDGDHAYENVSRDWIVIRPFLTSKDIVIFHDALGVGGVKKFLGELENTGTVEIRLLSDNPRRGIVTVKLK